MLLPWEVVLCCAPMGTRKGGRLGKLARETQLNDIIRSLSDSSSPNDRATADLPHAVEAAFEAFEKAGVPFPEEPHEVKRILRQGATTILREYRQLEDAAAKQKRDWLPGDVPRRHPEAAPHHPDLPGRPHVSGAAPFSQSRALSARR